MNVGRLLARWRVRLSYPHAILVLWVSRPIPRSLSCGAILGAIGLLIRARAAGYLHKQQILTMTGPYAYTRNPLYLGSAILALGIAVAANSWIATVFAAALRSQTSGGKLWRVLVLAIQEKPRISRDDRLLTRADCFYRDLALALAVKHPRLVRRTQRSS